MPGPKVVPVKPYRRLRFGRWEEVHSHRRGRRSKSPGGYNTKASMIRGRGRKRL